MSLGAVGELVLSFRRSFEHNKLAGETDKRPGIPNRRAFKTSLTFFSGGAHCDGHVCVVADFDPDGFKPSKDCPAVTTLLAKTFLSASLCS